jgi:hypothetical protein
MPTIIDALTVELGLDPSGFTKGQKDAEDAFLKTKDHAVSTGKTIEASSKKAAESLQLIARQALALFAVLLGGRGVKEFITDITKLDAVAGNLAANIGLDPKFLRAFGRAAEEMGGDSASAIASVQKLSALYQAMKKGDAELPKDLALLLSQGGQKFNLNDTPDVALDKIAKAVRRLTDEGKRVKAVDYAKSLGIPEAVINGMIKYGAAWRQHLKDSEKGPSPADEEAAKRRLDLWVKVKNIWDDVSEALTLRLSPAIEWAEQKLIDLGKWFEANPDIADEVAASLAILAAVLVLPAFLKVAGFFLIPFAGVANGLMLLAAGIRAVAAAGLALALNPVIATLLALFALYKTLESTPAGGGTLGKEESYGPDGKLTEYGKRLKGSDIAPPGAPAPTAPPGAPTPGASAPTPEGAPAPTTPQTRRSGWDWVPDWMLSKEEIEKKRTHTGPWSPIPAPDQESNVPPKAKLRSYTPSGETPAAAGAGSSTSAEDDRARVVMDEMIKQGASVNQAAALAGHSSYESHLSAITNPSEGAAGLIHWREGRRRALEADLASQQLKIDTSEASLRAQARFFWNEAHGAEAQKSKRFLENPNASVDELASSLRSNIRYSTNTTGERAARANRYAEAYRRGPSAGAVVDETKTSGLSGRGRMDKVEGLIVHHTSGRGDTAGVVNTLNQRGLSVQFVVDREGKLHELLPEGTRASHMKTGWGPKGEGKSNRNMQGVEVIARDDRDVTEAQKAAVVALAARQGKRYGYDPATSVFGHGEVNPGHKEPREGMSSVDLIRAGAARPQIPNVASGARGAASVGANNSRSTSNSSSTETHIGELNVHSAAQDATGIANDIWGALDRNTEAGHANFGKD